MMLKRFLSDSGIGPRFIVTSPAKDFEVLFEDTDDDAQSMGLAGIYKIPQ